MKFKDDPTPELLQLVVGTTPLRRMLKVTYLFALALGVLYLGALCYSVNVETNQYDRKISRVELELENSDGVALQHFNGVKLKSEALVHGEWTVRLESPTFETETHEVSVTVPRTQIESFRTQLRKKTVGLYVSNEEPKRYAVSDLRSYLGHLRTQRNDLRTRAIDWIRAPFEGSLEELLQRDEATDYGVTVLAILCSLILFYIDLRRDYSNRKKLFLEYYSRDHNVDKVTEIVPASLDGAARKRVKLSSNLGQVYRVKGHKEQYVIYNHAKKKTHSGHLLAFEDQYFFIPQGYFESDGVTKKAS